MTVGGQTVSVFIGQHSVSSLCRDQAVPVYFIIMAAGGFARSLPAVVDILRPSPCGKQWKGFGSVRGILTPPPYAAARRCMRQRRTDDGALRLDQPKLCFQLDGPNGAPTGFYTYNQQDSNR